MRLAAVVRPGRLASAWDALLRAVGYLSALGTGVLTLAVVYEVGARYFLGRPTNWVVDFTEYGLVYLTFFGAVWVLHRRGHVEVDTLVSYLPPRARLLQESVVALLMAGVLAVFVWKGTELTWEAYVRGDQMFKSWMIPIWPVRLPIPLGCLLMLVEALRQAGEGFTRWWRWTPAEGAPESERAEAEPQHRLV